MACAKISALVPECHVDSDPFRHLPALRDRVRPAQDSPLRVTPELLVSWDERARRMGRPRHWRLSDEELEASRRAVLGDEGACRDLWIYGYGSLMWDPGFHFAEVRLAALPGYQRRFSYKTTLGRGSPEQPGLMLSLEPCQGRCDGLVFRVAATDVAHESAIVWRREMIRNGYCPALLDVHTPQGGVHALVFGPNREHPDHVGELSLADTAAIIASGNGVLGSNRSYLEQLVEQLDHLGIEDRYLRTLFDCVRGLSPD